MKINSKWLNFKLITLRVVRFRNIQVKVIREKRRIVKCFTDLTQNWTGCLRHHAVSSLPVLAGANSRLLKNIVS